MITMLGVYLSPFSHKQELVREFLLAQLENRMLFSVSCGFYLRLTCQRHLLQEGVEGLSHPLASG